jgi:hypothetical protein
VKASWGIGGSSIVYMWGTKMRFNVCLAALAATLVASPAFAQQATTTETAEARGVVLQSLTLTKVSDLDFGTVAGSATTAGNVVIDANTGGRSGTGGVTLMPGASSRAQFDGLGVDGQSVQLTLTPPVGNVLVNGTTNLAINSMSLDSAGFSRTIDSTGKFTVYVGGDFQIAANQKNGLYSATFDLTADYQ